MFEIGFWELILVGVVALMVIGPEQLPTVARKAGFWLGRMRRFMADVKQDVDREFKAEELKRIIAQQAQSNPIHQIIEESSEFQRELEILGRTEPVSAPPPPPAASPTPPTPLDPPASHTA